MELSRFLLSPPERLLLDFTKTKGSFIVKWKQQHLVKIGITMIDFKKLLNTPHTQPTENPIEIYNKLDRQTSTGPLRPSQTHILTKWYQEKKEDLNTIIKLHTGEGKTLIGLLILTSKLSKKEGPCLYLCPNKQLVEQVCSEAVKFGIPYTSLQGDSPGLPSDFLDGTKILITHIQKLFNGKTIFGLNYNSTPVNSIVIDDSHACIDSIKNALKITIKRKESGYIEILNFFEEDLKKQGEGSYLEIKQGEYETLLPIPYWSWFEKSSNVTSILMNYRDENHIKFTWPLIKDNIKHCHAFISGTQLEICPFNLSIKNFGSFSQAKHRILMSATTQDDSFFIKGFDFDLETIRNPLTNPNQKWSGEKAILMPHLITEVLDRDEIINIFGKESNNDYGTAILAPSLKTKEQYESIGSVVTTSNNINEKIQELKTRNYKNPIVFVNRYDGIDLPDNACRLLIIDSLPQSNSLEERYEEDVRASSDTINLKISQKIEQGLGRSVRGEKDYSVIILTGNDLTSFIRQNITKAYFSEQTKKQFEISNILIQNLDEFQDSSEAINNLIKQILSRDDSWKEFYTSQMNTIHPQEDLNNQQEILHKEHLAEKYFQQGNIQAACNTMQSLADLFNHDESEKAWYIQQKARLMYYTDKLESENLQRAAFQKNQLLLKPENGISYTKLQLIQEKRITNIKSWVIKHKEDVTLTLKELHAKLTLGEKADKFEHALETLGTILGFSSERPDKSIKKGPDNLWCCGKNKYIMFECKSEVLSSRKEIKKEEIGQMNSHCGWFDNTYQDCECIRILIIHTKKISSNADLTHSVKIMRKNHLMKLKQNMMNFFSELLRHEIDQISDASFQELLTKHKLNYNNFDHDYSESPIL